MSVVQMRLLNMIGFIDELDSVVSACASLSAFEPDDVEIFFKEASKFNSFVSINDFTSLENDLLSIVSKINKNVKKVNIDTFINKKQISKYISSISEKINKVCEKKIELKEKIRNNNEFLNKLKFFKTLEYRISDIYNCKYVISKFIKMPKKDFQKLNSIYVNNRETKFLFDKISEYNSNCYCILFISKEFENQEDEILKDLKFEEINLLEFEDTPEQEIQNLLKENKEINSKIASINDGIEKFWNHQEQYCCKVYSCLKEYKKIEKIKKFAKIYKNNFALVGWVPDSKVNEISSKLDKISRIDYSIESGNELLKFSPPTKLKNNKIVSPFEFFVSMFGLPKYTDIDPTLFVAITYTIIFGIMFADVGQGFFLMLIGLLADKVKKINFGKILTFCGFSSMIFGFIFGSFFGFEHALDSIYDKIGFHPIRAMESPMRILISSVGLGIVCLLLAMFINIYSNIKKKKIPDAILSHCGLCGILFYSSTIFLLANNFMNLDKIYSLLSLIVASVSLVLIFLKEYIKDKLQNKKTNWGDYILSQFFELIEIVLGYFTNTVSFVRVGVFIFVHAGMMMVVFNLANMFSEAYYPIIVLGNLFVSLLESLLVGMQVMRLQFCELFGRFFEGGGREFRPVIQNR